MARPLIIPILGNTTDLEAALIRSGVVAEDASKKIQGSFRSAGLAAADEAKKMGASVDEQAAAAGRAAAAFTDMSAKITTAQRSAGKAAATAAGQVGASVDEQRAAYAKAIAVQSEYEAAVGKAAAAAKTAAAEQAAAAEEASARVKKAAEEQAAAVESAQKKMASLGKYALGGGVAIAGLSVKGAMDLQRAMEQIRTQAGATQGQVNQMTQAVLKMSPGLATGPQALADSLYHAFSATRNMTESLKIMSAAAKESKISGADLTDTTTALTASVFSGIGGAKNFSQAMGLLNATVGAGDMKFQNLNEAFAGPMLATVKGYGLNLKDVGAALATFGDLNIRGADAATQLRMAVQYMAHPAATAGPLLKELGLNVHSFADAMANGGLMPALQLLHTRLDAVGVKGSQMAQVIGDLFTKRGAAGVTILENSLDRLGTKYKQVGDGASKQNDAWNATQKTLAFEMDQLKATVESLADKFGLYLIPKLQATGQAVEVVIGWFGKHKTAAEALAIAIGVTLGSAVTVFAVTKTAALIKGTEDMVIGMSKVVSFATGSLIPSLTRTGDGLLDVGVKSSTAAAEVESQTATMAAAVETADTEIEVANKAACASFMALLGPIALAVGAAQAATAIFNKPVVGPAGGFASNAAARKYMESKGIPEAAIPQLIAQLDKKGAVGPDRAGVLGAGAPGTSMAKTTSPFGGAQITNPGGGSLAAGTAKNYTKSSFAIATLLRLGITPTPQNIDDFTAWENQEGGNWANNAKFNPLNTTMPEAGAGNTGSQGNIKVYQSWQQGLSATVATLKQSNMAAIVQALRGNASQGAFSSAVAGSPWGTGSINASGDQLSTKQLDALLNKGTASSTASTTSTIPAAVVTMLATAQALVGTPYSKAGHGAAYDPIADLKKIGIDCSGFVSRVLHSGGVNLPVSTTQGLPNYLAKGSGKQVTVYDRTTGSVADEHTLIEIMGKFFESGGNAKYNPSGRVTQLTSAQAKGELAGGGFQAYHPILHGPDATFKQLQAAGLSSSTSANDPINIGALVAAANAAIAKAADSLLQKLSNAVQSGTLRSLSSALGENTSTMVTTPGVTRTDYGRQVFSNWGSTSRSVASRLHSAIGGLGGHASVGQIDRATTGLVTQGSAGSTQTKAFESEVLALVMSGQTKLADKLVAAHKAAMQSLGQEMYAEQVNKDSEGLSLQSQKLTDQTTAITDAAQNQVNVLQAQNQLVNDKATMQVTAIRDMSQIVTDRIAAMVQSVQDQTQIMSDSMSAVATGINDQTQTQVDILGERGLFGLNLIAQQQKVALDEQKAADDKAIAAAQLNLDQVTANQHQLEANAQINLDQVTAAEDQVSALAQQRADTVAVNQQIRLSSAQAKLDANTLHNDVSLVGPAQIAVDLGATLPKAQQDVLNAQLKKAQGQAGVSEGGAAATFAAIQGSVNQLTAAAQQQATAVQNAANTQIGAAQATLNAVTGAANLAIASAQGTLTGVQGTAAITEAGLSGTQAVTAATAATQFAGSGLTQNFYGVDLSNPSQLGEAASWAMRVATSQT